MKDVIAHVQVAPKPDVLGEPLDLEGLTAKQPPTGGQLLPISIAS